MKKYLFLCAFIFTCFSAFGQKHSKAYIDSVQAKYFKNGARHYNYFSPKWRLYIDSALALTPENDYLWQQRAMPLFKARKYEAGMYYIDKAVALNPKRYLDYRAFIKCIFSKQYKASLVDFEKALKLNGDIGLMDHPYKFYMGLCYLQLNDFKKAQKVFLKVLADEHKMFGDDSTAHFLRYFYTGITYLELQDRMKAEKYFRLAIKNYEKFSDAQYYLALALFGQGKNKEGRQMLKEAKANFKVGYTITEDQVLYETYPYQIKNWFFKRD